MRTIGLLGGMSWESTAEYYRLINESVRDKLGGGHSAKIVLYSVDFAEIEELQMRGDWDTAATRLSHAAMQIEKAGADCVLICTNTMHKVADVVASTISIPLLHIAKATAEAIKEAGLSHIGLLGTRFTMEQDFYRGVLAQAGLQVLVPEEADRGIVHEVIYKELCQGIVSEGSRKEYVRIIKALTDRGSEGIVLGCTEIGLLIKQSDVAVPVFDTTRLHAAAAVSFALT